MSHLDMHELEDIVWEFSENDDHIVPHPGGNNSGYAIESEHFKRSRVEQKSTDVRANGMSASDYIIQRKEQGRFSTVKESKETMLEKNSWSYSSTGCLSSSLDGDANRNTSCSTSDEERTSKQCLRNSNINSVYSELPAGDSVIGDRAAGVDNLYNCQLNNTSHSDNDLAFFGDGLGDKESDDLLQYCWPELGNFEDFDNMFRSCDSTFGLEIGNTDELGWFSCTDGVEGSDDALKSSLNISESYPCGLNSETEQVACGLSSNGMIAAETDEKLPPVDCKNDLPKLIPNGSGAVVDSYLNDTHFQNYSRSPCKNQKSSDGKRKERSLDSSVSFVQSDNLNKAGEANHLLNLPQCLSSENHKRQDFSQQSCLEIPVPQIKPSNTPPSSHVLPNPMSSIVRSGDNSLPSISPVESSHASSQIQSVENSHHGSFQKNNCSRNKKKDRVHQRRFSRHTVKDSSTMQKAVPDFVRAEKIIPGFENEAEGQSEVDGNDIGTKGELDSSTMQESSCISSVLDDISIDASSLQQLQHVMDQLDIRTKLCIRDSLYRLARSAEQRHKCGRRDDADANGPLLSDGTNKCTGFMDMETDTNPIDRSIAHLLFHRPSDPSAAAASLAAVPMKFHAAAPPSHVPLKTEKRVCGEETTSTAEECFAQRN